MSKRFWSLQGTAVVSGLPPSKMLFSAGCMLMLLHAGFFGLQYKVIFKGLTNSCCGSGIVTVPIYV